MNEFGSSSKAVGETTADVYVVWLAKLPNIPHSLPLDFKVAPWREAQPPAIPVVSHQSF